MSKSWIVMSRKMPPERLDIVDRRRAGIARGDRAPSRPCRSAPSSIALRTAAKCGSKRRLKPTISLAFGLVAPPARHGLHALQASDRSASRRRSPCRPWRSARSGRHGCRSACRSPRRRCPLPPRSRRCCGPRSHTWRPVALAAAGMASATATSCASGFDGDRLGVHLADAACAQQGEFDGHGFFFLVEGG